MNPQPQNKQPVSPTKLVLSSKVSLVTLSHSTGPDGVTLAASLQVEGQEVHKERISLWLPDSRGSFVGRCRAALKKSLPDEADAATKNINEHLEKLALEKLAQPSSSKKPGLHTIKASQVSKGKIEWLWNKWIAKGSITNVTGDPGVGKGLLLAEVIAKLTTKGQLPQMPESIAPINVLILAVEDDRGTLRNRLEAAGADLNRVNIYTEYITKDGKETQFDVSRIADLEAAVKNLTVDLIIIDPVLDFLGIADSNKTDKVRDALLPLHQLAQRLNVAVVCIIHCNKNDVKALYKGSGSIQFAGKARSVLFMEKSPEDEKDVVVCHVKVNRSVKAASETFVIKQKNDNPELPYIQWKLDQTGRWKADDLLGGNIGATSNVKSSRLEVAKALLIGRLSVGPASTKEVEKLTEGLDVKEITMKRARQDLGVVTLEPVKPGPGSEYRMALPGHEKEPLRSSEMSHHVVDQLFDEMHKLAKRFENLEKRLDPPLADDPPLDLAHPEKEESVEH